MFLTNATFEELVKKIERLNKKFAKKHLPLLTYEAKNEVHTFGELFSKATLEHNNLKASWAVNVVNFEFTSNISEWIINSGWSIVAIINHEEHLIDKFVEDVDVEKYRESSFCEHCKTNRRRSKTIVIRDTEGNLKNVGTSCLSDFVKMDVNDIVRGLVLCSDMYAISENPEKEFYGISRGSLHYDIEEAIAASYKLIKEEGFTPSSEYGSTKNIVWNYLTGNYHINLNETDYQVVSEIKDWLKELKKDSSFNSNLVYIAENGFVSLKSIGYLVAGVHSFIKNASQKKEENKFKSEFVGTIGEKIITNAVITNKVCYDTMFGTVQVFTFADEKGNVFIWKTTSFVEPVVGNKVKIRGTVKEHNTYRDINQTALTRVKFL